MKTEFADFIAALRVELEDLWGHAEELIHEFDERKKAHAVTEHVYFGNIAVLKNEECCIQNLIHALDPVSRSLYVYDTLEELVQDIKIRFKTRVKCCGFAPCAYIFAERKVDKVYRKFRTAGVHAHVRAAI